MSRSTARRTSASSTSSRSGTVPRVSGWASAPYIDGSTSQPPASIEPVELVEHLVRVLDRQRVRRDHQRQSAGPLDLLDVLVRG